MTLNEVRLRQQLDEASKILAFIKGVLTGSAGDKELEAAMQAPMPGHPGMTKAEYFRKKLEKKGIKF